jgi:hypothetical protein
LRFVKDKTIVLATIQIMAETLGMLCDKLTIVQLKLYHTEDANRLGVLKNQATLLQTEIDEYLDAALSGQIEPNRLTFASNKVYKEEQNKANEATGNFGQVFYQLANVNCQLWHEQEKVYEFENVPVEEKDVVVKKLALLNLERNNCIDRINDQLLQMVKNIKDSQ